MNWNGSWIQRPDALMRKDTQKKTSWQHSQKDWRSCPLSHTWVTPTTACNHEMLGARLGDSPQHLQKELTGLTSWVQASEHVACVLRHLHWVSAVNSGPRNEYPSQNQLECRNNNRNSVKILEVFIQSIKHIENLNFIDLLYFRLCVCSGYIVCAWSRMPLRIYGGQVTTVRFSFPLSAYGA